MIRNAEGVPLAWLSTREGGQQIDCADEDPTVRQTYREALRRSGAPWRMDDVLTAEAGSRAGAPQRLTTKGEG